jgi:hypothetical protein
VSGSSWSVRAAPRPRHRHPRADSSTHNRRDHAAMLAYLNRADRQLVAGREDGKRRSTGRSVVRSAGGHVAAASSVSHYKLGNRCSWRAAKPSTNESDAAAAAPQRCYEIALYRLLRQRNDAVLKILLSGTALEPVNPQLVDWCSRSRQFAGVCSEGMVKRNRLRDRTRERTRTNAKPCHSCHARHDRSDRRQ